jgi:hypothetical protein
VGASRQDVVLEEHWVVGEVLELRLRESVEQNKGTNLEVQEARIGVPTLCYALSPDLQDLCL